MLRLTRPRFRAMDLYKGGRGVGGVEKREHLPRCK